MVPDCCTTALVGDGGSRAPAPLPGPPAVSLVPDGHVDIKPSTSQLCWVPFAHQQVHVRLCQFRVTTATATNSAQLRPSGFKDHPEMCHEMGLHSRAEPAWHPVPSPDCHLELDLELPLLGDRDGQAGQAAGTEQGAGIQQSPSGCWGRAGRVAPGMEQWHSSSGHSLVSGTLNWCHR